MALWKKEEEAKRYAEMYATEKKRTDVLEDLVKVSELLSTYYLYVRSCRLPSAVDYSMIIFVMM